MEFGRHFSRTDLEALFDDDFALPDDFMFGVANAAFQVEGGFNGDGEPLNNWAAHERAGKVERSGEAIRFWTDYPDSLELARGMGLNCFRLGLEWARVQPSASEETSAAPPFDEAAIEAYSDMIAAVRRAGMEPVVTLQHFTHPCWAGVDYWLEPHKLPLFERYVEKMAERLGTLLVEKHGLAPVRYWITLNEPNGLAMLTYLLRVFPHGSGGLTNTSLALSNMLDAHCRAYDTLHRVYREAGWDEPLVSYNTIHFAPYYLDKFVTDILLARRNGVARDGLEAYLGESRARWDEEIARCPEVRKSPWLSRRLEKTADGLTARAFKLDRFATALDALYSSPAADKLDYLAVDYYDPFLRNWLRAPSLQDVREKRLNMNEELWEQVLNPRGLYHFLKAETINGEGLPVLVAESGMSHKVYRGRVDARFDGATRDVFLQSYLYEVMRAVKDGIPVKSYIHWTLVDNYEWGSYEPRFGLFTVDRSRSPMKVSSVDAWGVNAGKTFGELIAALRSGDRGRMVEAFSQDDW